MKGELNNTTLGKEAISLEQHVDRQWQTKFLAQGATVLMLLPYPL